MSSSRRWPLSVALRVAALLALVPAAHLCAQTSPPVPVSTSAASSERALRSAVGRTGASAVVLDWSTGALLARAGAYPAAAPGSAIKPLLLDYALTHGIVRPDTLVYCRRNLRIGGRPVPCTHPDDQPAFTAERALAESCNTWFAALGRRFSGPQLEDALETSHLPHSDLHAATAEQRELAVLGLAGVQTSPLDLARAYRALLLRAAPEGTVVRGMEGSVTYGMAHPAQTPGITLLGKTGTAAGPATAQSHGWFAGAVPGRFILAIYVPHGDGGEAAALARKVVESLAGRKAPR